MVIKNNKIKISSYIKDYSVNFQKNIFQDYIISTIIFIIPKDDLNKNFKFIDFI